MKCIPAACILLLSGCGLWYGARPQCPLPWVSRVAVLPVRGAPAGQEERFGEILAAELVQFPGITHVVAPGTAERLRRREGLGRTDEGDLRALARALDADGVLVADLYEFNMHDPPRAEIWCSLVTARGQRAADDEVLNLPRVGALAPSRSGGAARAAFVHCVYDTQTHATSEAILWYGMRYEMNGPAGLSRSEWITRVGPNFFRFVCEQTLRDLFSELKKPPTNDRSE